MCNAGKRWPDGNQLHVGLHNMKRVTKKKQIEITFKKLKINIIKLKKSLINLIFFKFKLNIIIIFYPLVTEIQFWFPILNNPFYKYRIVFNLYLRKLFILFMIISILTKSKVAKLHSSIQCFALWIFKMCYGLYKIGLINCYMCF